MIKEAKVELNAVLTPPLSLESGSAADYRAPNLVQRVLSLFGNVRPGSDLSSFVVPPHFNLPKSHLQCFGESVYCIGDDLLHKCVAGKNPLERFVAVVAWSISTARPMIFGVAPFNPTLGETHHVSKGTLNVLLEQVSHRPPVTALHATDRRENVEIVWCQYAAPKFNGASVEVAVNGKRQMKLLTYGESYVLNSPKLFIRFFPVMGVDWVGNVTIQCEKSGLRAELCYGGSSFLGFRGNQRSVKGKIFNSASLKTIYEINGHWDRTITVRDVDNGKVTELYNAKDVISTLKTPMVKNPKGLWPSESAVVWNKVSQGILSKNWEKASEAKKYIEEREREMFRKRESKGETWIPKYFTLSYTKESGWECSPKQRWVPPAPIIVPSL
ncbi:PREDICTED: oxysterol-binding protein-related protein 4C [Nelumbo nucifera]|uniref:Oxysterol-binding protein-related protein 4C n=1 Tax=Nelumbo nucifera TaxID=4432 RepID=A0A1U8BBP1_NELNU|nr:PREDICTED: oxysterol-binding protein-related protein 4C [Nelumbo nucifera]